MTERKFREPRAWRVDFWCQDATPAQFIVTITDDASGIVLVNERIGQTLADVAGIVGKALKKFDVPGEVRVDLSHKFASREFRDLLCSSGVLLNASVAQPAPKPRA